MNFHAVMLDETRLGEFGVDIEADSRESAYAQLSEDYPESTCVQLESPQDAERREQEMHAHIQRGGDWDDEGRPIFPGGEWDFDDEEDDYDTDYEDE